MNHQSRILALACLATFASFACQAPDKGAKTGQNITKAADHIEIGMKQLDATVAALHDMTDKPAADLTTQRKAYEKSLADLESTAKTVGSTTSDMKASGQAYFAEWDKQLASIQNEDIRERSAERRKEIEKDLNKLREEYDEAKAAFDPLMSDFRDIRTALKADLTLTGIEALKPAANKVDKGSKSMNEKLKTLAEHFRALGVGLSRAGPPPTPPKK